MKIKTVSIIIFILFTANIIIAGSWKTKQPMFTSRNHLVIGVVNNKIYAIGGDGLTDNEEYDPVSNIWSVRSPMPTTRYWGFAAGTVAGKIYAMGGAEAGFYLKTNEEYDPSTDTWATKADMPTERFGLAIGVVGNKIYAIGGYNSTGVLSTNEEYDPSSDSWTAKTPMPTARYYLTASVVSNKVYLIGGYNSSSGGYLSIVEEYDPATDSWTSKTPMPTARGELASGVLKDTIYAVGGWDGVSDLNTNEAYDPTTDNWTSCPLMPTARSGLAVGIVADSLYAVGGLQGFTYLATNEQYSPDLTNIESLSFCAHPGNGCIELRWTTPMEDGCQIYKIVKKMLRYKGDYLEIAHILAKGPSPSSKSYLYKDEDVIPGTYYNYKLEVVKTDGTTRWFGPVTAVATGNKPFLRVSPNPFTQETEIKWALGIQHSAFGKTPITNDQCPMTISIYDVRGRLVRNLVTGERCSGALMWDGTDETGKKISPGTYFAKINVDNSSLIEKIIFLK